MTPERWSRVREIFTAALEHEEESRPAFVKEACGSDSDMRREVERLLREQTGSSFLQTPLQKLSLAGQTISHYEVLEQLGAGGMGVVYKARDTVLKRHVALKVLPPAYRQDPDRRRRLLREAQTASALNHPNIATVHDIFEYEGADFIVMEYIEGKTLDRLIGKGGMQFAEVLSIAVQIADALDRAHRAGVTHRDIKPQNIMLPRDGVKVLDFGLAKSAQKPGPSGETDTNVLTKEGTVLGTPQYMAPEQFEGAEADARSDVWAFGAVLYEMVTGQKAFQGKSHSSLVTAILSAEPAPMAVKPFTPAALEKLVKRCLNKDPEDRYQSMRDALLDLRSITTQPEAAGKPPAARPWIAWALAALATAAALFLAFTHFSEREPQVIT
ncbi:MAG: serine/threonine protein kinase, partial [bacterium]|nr:serine/threonine protein kinase [bacterium]